MQIFSAGDYLHYRPDYYLLRVMSCALYRMLNYISGIYPLDASSTTPPKLWQPNMFPNIIKSPLYWQNHSRLKTTALRPSLQGKVSRQNVHLI